MCNVLFGGLMITRPMYGTLAQCMGLTSVKHRMYHSSNSRHVVKKNHLKWGLGVDRAVEAGADVVAGMWSHVQARCLVLDQFGCPFGISRQICSPFAGTRPGLRWKLRWRRKLMKHPLKPREPGKSIRTVTIPAMTFYLQGFYWI